MKGLGALSLGTAALAGLSLFVAVASLTLAACGGSGDIASSSPSPVSSQATASPSVLASPSGIPLPTPTVTGTIAFTREGEDEFGLADYDICAVNTDGTGLTTLAGGEGCQMYPRWSPDGSKITYMEGPQGDLIPQEVWVMNADGSGKVQITKSSLAMRCPDWSPDGTQIVFSNMVRDTSAEQRIAIYVMDPDGSGQRKVTTKRGGATDYWPMWARDGRIYFWRFNASGAKPGSEFSVNPDGSGLERLMKLGSVDRFLKFGLSPDGKKVALQIAGAKRLVVVPARGGGAPVTLLHPVADYLGDAAADVAWSPDEKALAIAGLFDTGFTRLYVVNADGSGLSAVPGIGAARDPAWRPE